ncbi:hypothetical protein [Phreatobacter sp.]|uniref:hypothetical protein n=1 Tax=Phreatobacter sp. TaxID=1966341 RepID=UPI0022C035B7|nr:hypothetical protein [Phreatobacter sp.]MCZ8315528.1 hypothetical protein [Phreatobacter sp.]
MRHGLITAATAAIIAATGALLTAPLAAAPLAGPRLAAPATATSDLVPVQYWGGWGPRYYDYDDEPPVYRRRYVVPEVEDVIAPAEAVAIARSMGYRAISRPRLAGRVWVVETVGGAGQRARVTINAYSGAPINIRELEPSGPRFSTPPAWPEERPSFGREGAVRAPPPIREGRLDPDGFERPERPERPARPAPNITARAVPVPEPRPNLGRGLDDRPAETPPLPPVASPPPAEAPVAPPPAASVPPRRVDPPAAVPVPQTPPLSVEPQQPITPPAVTAPQAVEPPAPAVTAPPVEPAPPAAATPAPQPDRSAVEPPVAVQPPQVTPPAPAAPTTETAQRPESDGVLIDGRFLGPNGEAPPPGSRP